MDLLSSSASTPATPSSTVMIQKDGLKTTEMSKERKTTIIVASTVSCVIVVAIVIMSLAFAGVFNTKPKTIPLTPTISVPVPAVTYVLPGTST